MDRKAAIATATAVALGIGAAAVAVAANIGSLGSNGDPVGKLRRTDTSLTQSDTSPRVVTVYVDETPTPEPAQIEVVTETASAEPRATSADDGNGRVEDDREHEEEPGDDHGGDADETGDDHGERDD